MLESTQNIQSFLSAIHASMMLVNHEGCIVHVNQAFEQLAKKTPFLKAHFAKNGNLLSCQNYEDSRLVHNHEICEGLTRAVSSTPVPFSTILEDDSCGLLEYFRVQIDPIPDNTDVAAVITVSCITDQKKTEIEDLTRKRRIECVLEGTGAGTWEWDISKDIITVNDRWCEMLGYTKEELYPISLQTFYDMLHPDDKQIPPDAYERYLKAEDDYYECEVRIKHKDGSWVWIKDSGRFVSYDDNEEPTIMYGVHTDITPHKRMEEELNDTNQKRLELMRSANVGFWEWDLNTNEVSYSKEWKQQLGYEEHEIGNTYDDWYSRLHPEEREPVVQKIKNFISLPSEAYGIEFRLRHKDGSYRWMYSQCIKFLDENGTPYLVRGTHIDITRQKEIQLEMEASELRYRQMFEENKAIKLILDPADGKIINANKSACSFYGYSHDDITLMSIYDINVAPRDQVKQRMEEASDSVGQFYTFQHRLASGEIRDIQVFTGPVYLVDRQLIYCIIIDITERRKIEAERELLSAAIEQSQESIVIMDRNGCIEYANPVFVQNTEFSRDDVIGKPLYHFEGEEQDRNFYDEVLGTLGLGGIWEGQVSSLQSDGTPSVEKSVISPVFDESGMVRHFIAVKRDITKEVQLEDQLRQVQRMESIGRLAGGIAHDFNNMLSVITGYASMAMLRLSNSDPLQNDMKEILNAADRSSSLTRQLLAFARKQMISPRVIDLNSTVESMLTMLERLIGESIALKWLPNDDLEAVCIDPGQVDQILANLCVNARDAINGIGQITIETANASFDESYGKKHSYVTAGDYVQIAISDNGCGMEQELLDVIFEPFFTTKDVGEGTGLGLATVYGIVKQNDGFVHVYSEPGKGTTFRVYLPRHAGDVATDDKPIEKPALLTGDETILIVEDEPSLLAITEKILSNLGYTILTAKRPQEAITLAYGYPKDIHLLLSDVVMPEMNGRELSEQILRAYPAMKRVFMSGYTANLIEKHGVLQDNLRFIQKPFAQQHLAEVIRSTLDE